MLVMLQMSLDNLGAYVLAVIVVGVCFRMAWRICVAMVDGISASGMVVVHRVYLLARRSRP